ISILLVDDHPVVRQGYRRVLENQRDFRVVAEADSATRAYAAFKTHAPDVVVMDISMKGASGLEAIRNIRSRDKSARILVFSMHTDAAVVKEALAAGAGGSLQKASDRAPFVRPTRAAAGGGRARRHHTPPGRGGETPTPPQSTLDRLGHREVEILR